EAGGREGAEAGEDGGEEDGTGARDEEGGKEAGEEEDDPSPSTVEAGTMAAIGRPPSTTTVT
ncbi:hypothetical protein, partial [Actinoplanes utahensis]|uniref:hypothetical protein n=1 Tax=Actinoplanes utahensis TaxID=1869 RepID=UPI0019508F82